MRVRFCRSVGRLPHPRTTRWEGECEGVGLAPPRAVAAVFSSWQVTKTASYRQGARYRQIPPGSRQEPPRIASNSEGPPRTQQRRARSGLEQPRASRVRGSWEPSQERSQERSRRPPGSASNSETAKNAGRTCHERPGMARNPARSPARSGQEAPETAMNAIRSSQEQPGIPI